MHDVFFFCYSHLKARKWVDNVFVLSLIIINKKYKKFTEITTKRTEITGTSCRYMFTGFKNVSFLTLSNMLMISSKKMWKNTKKPEVVILHVFI